MKLITFKKEDKTGVAIFSENYIYPLPFSSMNELIDSGKSFEEIEKSILDKIPTNEVEILAPIPQPKQDIICLGINYMEHAVESARYKKETFGGDRPYAVYFSKRVNEALPNNGFLSSYENMVDSLDYECELALIISKDCKNVKKENAFNYVFGYTIINDISARNLQTRHKQWYFGKSLDGFTPMGPVILTKDELKNPPILEIKSYVNGELRQNSNTNLLIFDIPHVIEELSSAMTLKAGTIISMGTPAGVGMGFVPPKFLKSGDVVDCYIEKIGTLRTYIK